jgi:hypothetical protein
MEYGLFASLLAVGPFPGMLVLLEVGRRIGVHRLEQDPEGARAGVGTVEGAVFALLGLLIAFTFSGAASRFDARRQLIISVTAAELSGQVFNLQTLEDFNGNYKIVEVAGSVGGSGALATIQNQNGVVVNVIATTGGRKFTLGADGMTIELKK